MTAQQLYEQFIKDVGQEGRCMSWAELPPLVRDAWTNVKKSATPDLRQLHAEFIAHKQVAQFDPYFEGINDYNEWLINIDKI